MNPSCKAVSSIFIILFFSMFLGGKLLYQTIRDTDFESLGKDTISNTVHEYEPLKEHLPGFGDVGYLNNLTLIIGSEIESGLIEGDVSSLIHSEKYKKWNALLQYRRLLVQYALCPLVVHYTLDFPFVIGDLRDCEPAEVKKELLERGYRIEKEFENGIVLIAKD